MPHVLGDGSGGFTKANGSPFAVGSSPSSLAIADLNGDGRADLAVANGFYSNDVSVLLGTGTGKSDSFLPQVRFAVGDSPSAIVTADLNRDGRLDLVTANNGSNDVSALLMAASHFRSLTSVLCHLSSIFDRTG